LPWDEGDHDARVRLWILEGLELAHRLSHILEALLVTIELRTRQIVRDGAILRSTLLVFAIVDEVPELHAEPIGRHGWVVSMHLDKGEKSFGLGRENTTRATESEGGPREPTPRYLHWLPARKVVE
jgi:hypothetical protein